MKLKDKVALVTGSSQGIGQEIVLRLAPEGANVIIDYRSHPKGAEDTLAKVEAVGGECYVARCSKSHGFTIKADLGSVSEVQHLGQPQDIASLVAFLASTDADYITVALFLWTVDCFGIIRNNR